MLLALSLLGGKKAQQRKQALADPWSPESIAQALDVLIPLVEKHAGAKFTERPVVRLAKDVPFRDLMVAQMEWAYAQLTPDAPEELRSQLAQQTAEGMLGGVFGVYNYVEEEVYLESEIMQRARQGAGLSPDHEHDLMMVVLAHEITHTLEDQVVDLKRSIQTAHDIEQFTATGCTWEGWATWVSGAVSKELGLEDAFWKTNALQGWNREGTQDPGAWTVAFRYGQGYRFMDHQVAQGGTAQAWRTLRHPPATTGMIYRPERYDPTLPTPPRDYAALLEGADQAVDSGPWAMLQGRIGEAELRAAAAYDDTGMEDVDRMLSHLVWGHMKSLERPDKSAAIVLMEFDSPEAADAWMDTVAGHETAEAAHDAAKAGKAVLREITPLPDLAADRALERAITPPGARIPLTQGMARTGPLLIVVQTERFIPGLRLERTLAHVLDQVNPP